ncbi:helix-turn-helix transcriptional regulator [Actinoplanes sp. NBC_00393]
MPELPDREREILRLVATGASNAAIARSLYLSEATVKQYVSRLMRRFDRENRTQLALLAAQWFDGFA